MSLNWVSADEARFTRCRHRRTGLDHARVQAPVAGIRDAGGPSDHRDQRRTDKRHHHDLEVGHAVGGEHRGVVHGSLPWGNPQGLLAHWSPQRAKRFISSYGPTSRKVAIPGLYG